MKKSFWNTQSVIGVLLALLVFVPLPVWAQGALGTPAEGSTVSGISLIRGYLCTPPASGFVDIVIDGSTQLQAAYGTSREDTAQVCNGETDTGWGITWNWNISGEGEHTIQVLADGEEFGSATFNVGRPSDEEFLRGAPGTFYILPDFPSESSATIIQWQEGEQNFMITDSASGVVPDAGTWTNSVGGEYDICWNVSDDGSSLTSVGSSCEDGESLRLEATGVTDNGLDCVFGLASYAEIPITAGLFVYTIIDPVGIDSISSTAVMFTDMTNAEGRAVISSVTVDSCRVEFTNSL